MNFLAVIGSFRILRRRAVEVDRPGLSMWAEQGERSARLAANTVRDKVHADEVCDHEAAKHIEAGLAGLKDGRVDPADVAHFEAAARLTKRSADLAHEAGEVVKV